MYKCREDINMLLLVLLAEWHMCIRIHLSSKQTELCSFGCRIIIMSSYVRQCKCKVRPRLCIAWVLNGQMCLTERYTFLSSLRLLDEFRHSIDLANHKLSVESISPDQDSAQAHPSQYLEVVHEGGYKLCQVFSTNKTALYWKRMRKLVEDGVATSCPW